MPGPPQDLFDSVRVVLEKLEADYPDVVFMWWTMVHSEKEKHLVTNHKIHEYNELVRAYCLENEKWLLDISALETHEPNGTPVLYDGHPIIYSGYTTDGGHLIAAGQERVARAYWKIIAKIEKSLSK